MAGLQLDLSRTPQFNNPLLDRCHSLLVFLFSTPLNASRWTQHSWQGKDAGRTSNGASPWAAWSPTPALGMVNSRRRRGKCRPSPSALTRASVDLDSLSPLSPLSPFPHSRPFVSFRLALPVLFQATPVVLSHLYLYYSSWSSDHLLGDNSIIIIAINTSCMKRTRHVLVY
jgi:hypothetical protein